MEKRPILDPNITIQDFRDFYWYKEELVAFCRCEKLEKHGGKLELASRIEKYLETGEKESSQKPSNKLLSRFDWSVTNLTTKTIITDNYQNTENVRAFFKKELGAKFKFNVRFMNWMKTAEGKTLQDAIEKWLEIYSERKAGDSPKKIAPQFEYNTYIPDFLKDNPTMDRETAIECWKIRKQMRGDNKYSAADLALLEK